MKVYAKFVENCGWNDDKKRAIDNGLVIGKTYEVDEVIVHSYHTRVYLKGFKDWFNSVAFEFYNEDGTESTIIEDAIMERQMEMGCNW